jgi:hypothetical protein
MASLLPRRRIWRAAIYVVSFLLVLIAADLVLVQVRRTIHPGYETTRFLGPLLPDGRIDYIKIVDDQLSAGVTPENNAAVPLLLAFGRAALPSTQPPDGITDRLGMAHLPKKGEYLITYSDFCKEHHEGGVADNSRPDLPKHWPATISPVTARWVQANARPLDLVVEASKRSRFFIPFDGGNRPEAMFSILLPHLRILIDAGDLLVTRAMMRLQANDVSGSLDDLMAVHRLARLSGQSAILVEWLLGERDLEAPACEAERVVAASGKLSADRARGLAAQLEALGDLQPIDGAINDGERLAVLDCAECLAAGPPARSAELLAPVTTPTAVDIGVFRFMPVSYEDIMRSINHLYDGGLAALREPTYPRRAAALAVWRDQLPAPSRFGPLSLIWSPDWITCALYVSIHKVAEYQEEGRMELRLTRIALALAAYKADHGRYPAALEALAPGYLPAVPEDSFSERPPIYAPTGAGYTLYSVGPNMIDDGGGQDDIVASVP